MSYICSIFSITTTASAISINLGCAKCIPSKEPIGYRALIPFDYRHIKPL